ncbi:MAG: hypothetical protein Q8N88_02535 [Nanoarchaeota archaeon]|nr:hypothetical protein [Nanoarchaeota archaeon]
MLAYALTDTSQSQYDPKGKIFLMDFDNKQKDRFLGERKRRVNALCYCPNLGLFDTGNYTRVYTNNDMGDSLDSYALSGLFRVLDSRGRLVNKPIISVEHDYEKSRKSLEEVLKKEKFHTGLINDLCFVPEKGLIGIASNGIYLLVDSTNRLVINRFIDSRDDADRIMKYIPQLGIVCSSQLSSTLSGEIECYDLNGNSKNIGRFDNSKGKVIFEWTEGWNVPDDLKKRGFGNTTSYGGARDIAWVPNLGMYVADDDGLRFCIKPSGEIVDKRITNKKFRNLCFVPNRGLIGVDMGCGKLRRILDERGNVTLEDIKINPLESKGGFDEISALTAIPKNF